MNESYNIDYEEVYSDPSVEKLISYYKNSRGIGGYYDALINFLASKPSNNYSYAKTKTDEVCHRQGKNRKLVDTGQYKLSLNYEGVFNANDNFEEMFTEILNQFIAINNAQLETAKQAGNTSGVHYAKKSLKALLTLVFKSNLYYLIGKLDLPNYVVAGVNNVLAMISQGRSNIFNQYKDKLRSEGYESLVPVIDQIGMEDFFLASKTKSKDMFRQFFTDKFEELGTVDSEEYSRLLRQYEGYKNLYHAYYDKLNIKDIVPYFNQSDSKFTYDMYDKIKYDIISKINNIAENLGDDTLINKLIYNENN